jgi:hypothetical protein
MGAGLEAGAPIERENFMMGLVVISSPADQGGPLAYAKTMLIPVPTLLESLTIVSKSTSACYVQLLDYPRLIGVAITDTDSVTGVITAAAHNFVTGDRVTLTGIAGVTTAYLNAATADTFTLYTTRALAIAGGTPDVLPSIDNDTGSLDLASYAAGTVPVIEEYPVGAASSAPTNVVSVTNARFKRGLYVRAVTAQNGSTLISAADIKYTPRYRNGDIVTQALYED